MTRAPISAGRLRYRLTLLRKILVDDGLGRRPVWTVLQDRTPADRQFISDGERLRAQQQGATVTVRFTVRNEGVARTLTSADEVASDGVRYGISNVKPVDRERFLEITAHAQADGGAP